MNTQKMVCPHRQVFFSNYYSIPSQPSRMWNRYMWVYVGNSVCSVSQSASQSVRLYLYPQFIILDLVDFNYYDENVYNDLSMYTDWRLIYTKSWEIALLIAIIKSVSCFCISSHTVHVPRMHFSNFLQLMLCWCLTHPIYTDYDCRLCYIPLLVWTPAINSIVVDIIIIIIIITIIITNYNHHWYYYSIDWREMALITAFFDIARTSRERQNIPYRRKLNWLINSFFKLTKK